MRWRRAREFYRPGAFVEPAEFVPAKSSTEKSSRGSSAVTSSVPRKSGAEVKRVGER
jgi:hypothetical protein